MPQTLRVGVEKGKVDRLPLPPSLSSHWLIAELVFAFCSRLTLTAIPVLVVGVVIAVMSFGRGPAAGAAAADLEGERQEKGVDLHK